MSEPDDEVKLTICLTNSYSAWFSSFHEGKTLKIITELHIDALTAISIIFKQVKTENIKHQYMYGITF